MLTLPANVEAAGDFFTAVGARPRNRRRTRPARLAWFSFGYPSFNDLPCPLGIGLSYPHTGPWDHADRQRVSDAAKEVIHNPRLDADAFQKAPDYVGLRRVGCRVHLYDVLISHSLSPQASLKRFFRSPAHVSTQRQPRHCINFGLEVQPQYYPTVIVAVGGKTLYPTGGAGRRAMPAKPQAATSGTRQHFCGRRSSIEPVLL
jgi:hypothetical protein